MEMTLNLQMPPDEGGQCFIFDPRNTPRLTSPNPIMTNLNNFNADASGPLFALTDAVFPVSDEAKKYIKDKIELVQVSKGTLLVTAGQHCDHLYFVNKGVLRGYVKQENKDITTWITA